MSGAVEGGVTLVVEQLRRQVPGGVGTYVRGLLAGLEALGSAAPPYRLFASRPLRHPDPLEQLGLPLELASLPAPAVLAAWRVGLDGVRGPGALTHALSFSIPPSATPLVVTVHDLAWRALPDAYPPRGRRFHEAALRAALRRAVRLVVPSVEVAEALMATGAEEGRVAVIAEGADHLPEPDLAGARALLTRLGVDGPFYLSVGTLEPRKNLTRLFAAYAELRRRTTAPWPLVVIGPNGWGPDLKALPEGAVLGGRCSDGVLAGCYAMASCFVYVPLLEGFGLPVLEAMRAGTAVVASRVPSAGEAALVVDARSVASIAEALFDVAADPTLRGELEQAGCAHVEPLTWRACAAAHVALWADVVGGVR